MNRLAKDLLMSIGLLTLAGTSGAEPIATGGGQAGAVQPGPSAVPDSESLPRRGSGGTWSERPRAQHEIDRVFENSWQRMQADLGSVGARPTAPSAMRLKEEKDAYLVTTDLPGIEEGDLDVSLDGRLLRILARTRSEERETEDQGRLVREESYSSDIQRAFTLSGSVDATGMHSRLENGVLTIRIPKAHS